MREKLQNLNDISKYSEGDENLDKSFTHPYNNTESLDTTSLNDIYGQTQYQGFMNKKMMNTQPYLRQNTNQGRQYGGN